MIRGMCGLTARRLVTATLSAALLATGVGMAAPASAAPDCPSGYACAWGDRYYLTAGSQAKRVQFVNGISNMSLHYYAGTSRHAGNDITSVYNNGNRLNAWFYTQINYKGPGMIVRLKTGRQELNATFPSHNDSILSGRFEARGA